MNTTRHHRHLGHCRHHGIIHQTLWIRPGNMGTIDTMELYTRHKRQHKARWTPWALQTPWYNTPDTMYATRQHGHHLHCRHQQTIHNTLWTPPDTAYTRKPYTGRYIHHKQPCTPSALQRPGNYTTDTMDTTRIHGQCRQQGTLKQTIFTTRHNGHHGQWIQEGTIQQTL